MKPRYAPYLFVLPNVLLVALFVLYPLLYNVVLSLQTGYAGATRFAGLMNYGRLFDDSTFFKSVLNTLIYTVGVVPAIVLISLAIAIGLNQKFPGRSILRSVFFLPYLFSWSVVGLIWRQMYSTNSGLLNIVLGWFGIPDQRWLLDSALVMPSIILAAVWSSVGYYMVIFLAGLQGIPDEYYEAASVDGAGAWAKLRYITLPTLWPITALVVVLATIQSFRVFEQIYVMTGGGPGTSSFVVVLYLYITGFVEQNLGYSAAMSTLLFLVVLGFTIVQTRLLRARE